MKLLRRAFFLQPLLSLTTMYVSNRKSVAGASENVGLWIPPWQCLFSQSFTIRWPLLHKTFRRIWQQCSFKGHEWKHTQNNYEAADLLLVQHTPLANICSRVHGRVSLVFLQCFRYWILQLYLRGTWFQAVSIIDNSLRIRVTLKCKILKPNKCSSWK